MGWKYKYKSPWNDNGSLDDVFYVKHINDLRVPCDIEDCPPFSDNISNVNFCGGTWCYAYSLSGAKKVLKLIDDNANNHIDQILMKATRKNKIKVLAFDPPIVWHEMEEKLTYHGNLQ